MSEVMCGVKVKCGSKVTPSMRGFLSSGRGELLRVTCGWVWDWCLSDVKSVTVDLGAEIDSPFSSAQAETLSA